MAMKSSVLVLALAARALAECVTDTTVMLGIDATISDLAAWQSSMDEKYSDIATKSGSETVFVHTSVYTYPGGSFIGYQTYNSEALISAGYNIVTQTATITSCAESTEPTASLPPSPTTGINCEPHNDHWHCDPLPTDTESDEGECEPHDDHWHCPPGVPEPTTPPAANAAATKSSPTTPSGTPAGTTSTTEAPSGGAAAYGVPGAGLVAMLPIALGALM